MKTEWFTLDWKDAYLSLHKCGISDIQIFIWKFQDIHLLHLKNDNIFKYWHLNEKSTDLDWNSASFKYVVTQQDCCALHSKISQSSIIRFKEKFQKMRCQMINSKTGSSLCHIKLIITVLFWFNIFIYSIKSNI